MAVCKRVIVCLDVRAGQVTKGVKFQGNVDLGDPVDFAQRYDRQGADELVFYDITASAEQRGLFVDVVRRVAEQVFIPFCVGGGIRSVAAMREVLLAGAEKVSVNSPAVRAAALGAGEICLNAIDTDGVRNGYELAITRMVADAVGIPVIASGGGGTPQHLIDAVTAGGAEAALVASMVHYGDYTIGTIKDAMHAAGIPVRLELPR